MSLPASNYASATLVNPTAALSDFPLLVDLSRMPAEWWAAVDTTDGTRGRAAKGDGTELACDWIDFDAGNETGWLRVAWAGTLASSGTQELRVYPPRAANAAVSAGDTYGRHAVYPSAYLGYHPLDGDGNDRTVNAAHLTLFGSPSYDGAKVGRGLHLSAGNNGARHVPSVGYDSYPLTMMLWFRADAISNSHIIGISDDDDIDAGNTFYMRSSGSTSVTARYDDGGGTEPAPISSGLAAETWMHLAATLTSSDIRLYIDGSLADSRTNTNAASVLDRLVIGGNNAIPGHRDDAHWLAADLDAAWIAQEYAQSSDQAAFWGAWTDNPAPSTGRRRKAMVLA